MSASNGKFGSLKESAIAYFGGKAKPSGTSTQDKSNMAQNTTKYSGNGALQTQTVQKLKTELEKERHKHKSLIGSFRKANSELKRLKEDYEGLAEQHDELQESHEKVKGSYESLLNKVVIPWAQHKGLDTSRKRDISVSEATLHQLLQDATQTDASQALSHNNQNSMLAAQMQMRDLQGQLQASQKHVQGLREEVAKSQSRTEACFGRLEESKAQAASLRDQVQELQRDMLARIEKTRIISDEHLAQDFSTLVSMIRSLSRMIRFPDSVNIADTLSPMSFLEDVPVHHWTGRARKRTFVEAWLWSTLLMWLFQNPFQVFGEAGKGLEEVCSLMFGRDHDHGWPSPSSSCEIWRCTTADRLVQVYKAETSAAGDSSPTSGTVGAAMLDTRTSLINVIEAHLGSVFPIADADHVQINRIVDQAISLAAKMSAQRSRLQITCPRIGAPFINSQMSFMPDRDGDDIEDGVVAFVVNPGLTKWGDAHGQKYDCRFDIVPSLVQLESMGTEESL